MNAMRGRVREKGGGDGEYIDGFDLCVACE